MIVCVHQLHMNGLFYDGPQREAAAPRSISDPIARQGKIVLGEGQRLPVGKGDSGRFREIGPGFHGFFKFSANVDQIGFTPTILNEILSNISLSCRKAPTDKEP